MKGDEYVSCMLYALAGDVLSSGGSCCCLSFWRSTRWQWLRMFGGGDDDDVIFYWQW